MTRYSSIIVLSFLLTVSSFVSAQDQSNFTQFYLNPYLLNPAFAGIDGKTSVGLIYRRQWATIADGPTVTNVSLHTPINARLATGFSATSDKRGLLDNTALLLSLGFALPIQKHTFIRFGLSAGGAWNKVDLEKLASINDPKVPLLLENNTSLVGNAGISFHAKTFHLGVAMPLLFQPAYVSEDAFTIKEVAPFQSIIIHTSNRFYFNKNKHVFEPYVNYRINSGLPSQVEVAGVLHLNHLVWVGGSYKQDFGISALGGIKLQNVLAIGASYSLSNSGINELNSPTYEISLNYLFGKKKKDAQVYSFVNTVKEKEKKSTHKSASELIAEKHKQEELAKKEAAKKAPVVAAQKTEPVKQTPPPATKIETQQKPKTEPAVVAKTEPQQKPKTEPVVTKTTTQQPPKTEPVVAKTEPQQKPKSEPVVVAKTETQQPPKTEPTVTKTETPLPKTAPIVVKPEEKVAPKVEPVKETVKTENIVTKVETPTPVIESPKAEEKPVVTPETPIKHRPRFSQDVAFEPLLDDVHSIEDEKERLERLTLHAENPTELHGLENEAHPHAERHEFVQKGGHAQELDVADYVIGGVFRSEANAKHFSEGLKRLKINAHYGHLTAKDLWYVYIIQTTDINVARSERDKYRKTKLLRDAWLLTVHH